MSRSPASVSTSTRHRLGVACQTRIFVAPLSSAVSPVRPDTGGSPNVALLSAYPA